MREHKMTKAELYQLLREIAHDCEECAQGAEVEGNYGEARAWRAVAAKAAHGATS